MMMAKFRGAREAALGAVLSFPLVVHAQSAPGEAVFTELGTQAATYITAGFVLLAVVLGGTLGMKLVKKILSRAT